MKFMIGIDWPVGEHPILNSRYIWITTFTRNSDQPDLWWCHKTRKWVTSTLNLPQGGSTHVPCHSYKAFERHLKKHAAELEGYEVVLVHRFKGYEVTAQVWK